MDVGSIKGNAGAVGIDQTGKINGVINASLKGEIEGWIEGVEEVEMQWIVLIVGTERCLVSNVGQKLKLWGLDDARTGGVSD